MNAEIEFPIGALVSQNVHKGDEEKRYGIIFKATAHLDDRLLSILWQLNLRTHAVASKAYIEPVLLFYSESIGRPLELIKRMPDVP